MARQGHLCFGETICKRRPQGQPVEKGLHKQTGHEKRSALGFDTYVLEGVYHKREGNVARRAHAGSEKSSADAGVYPMHALFDT